MAFGKCTRREGMDFSTNIRGHGNKSFIILCTDALTCDRGAKKLEMSAALLLLPTQSDYINCAGKESLHKERSAGAQRKEVGFCTITRTYAGEHVVSHTRDFQKMPYCSVAFVLLLIINAASVSQYTWLVEIKKTFYVVTFISTSQSPHKNSCHAFKI